VTIVITVRMLTLVTVTVIMIVRKITIVVTNAVIVTLMVIAFKLIVITAI